MNDRTDTHGDATGAGTGSEDARRYYLERGGREAGAGETVVAQTTEERRTTEHAAGGAPLHATETRRVETVRTEGGSEDRDRALGEAPHAGSEGPHVLEQSFSGTYSKDHPEDRD